MPGCESCWTRSRLTFHLSHPWQPRPNFISSPSHRQRPHGALNVNLCKPQSREVHGFSDQKRKLDWVCFCSGKNPSVKKKTCGTVCVAVVSFRQQNRKRASLNPSVFLLHGLLSCTHRDRPGSKVKQTHIITHTYFRHINAEGTKQGKSPTDSKQNFPSDISSFDNTADE